MSRIPAGEVEITLDTGCVFRGAPQDVAETFALLASASLGRPPEVPAPEVSPADFKILALMSIVDAFDSGPRGLVVGPVDAAREAVKAYQ